MTSSSAYRKLDLKKTLESIDHLKNRIQKRFPESNLAKVCEELYQTAFNSSSNIRFITRPIWWLRISFTLIIALFIPTFYYVIEAYLKDARARGDLKFTADEMESAIQILILVAGAIYFILRIEGTIKRKKTLSFLNELKTLAHVIDMHQLTKGPNSLTADSTNGTHTKKYSNIELIQYLNYCNEMLSLTSKVSALYGNDYDDEVVLNSINEIEALTLGLNQKIWQKMILINKE